MSTPCILLASNEVCFSVDERFGNEIRLDGVNMSAAI